MATTHTSYPTRDFPYLRLRNTGAYPIRITGIVGGDGGKAAQFYGGGWFSGNGCGVTGLANISDYFYLAPGEEKYFGVTFMYSLPCDRFVSDVVGASGGIDLGASSVCQASATSPGFLSHKTFGFEYIEYLDNNQQITKKQIGKELLIRCKPPPF